MTIISTLILGICLGIWITLTAGDSYWVRLDEFLDRRDKNVFERLRKYKDHKI